MGDNDFLIKKLKEYFENRQDVVMAFLFGSHAEGRAHSGSDWDIAVYFKPAVERIEWEEQGREYPEEDRVWEDCIDILKTDKIDLIVLNRASVSIVDSAIRGTPLVIKDRGLYLDFMLIITGAAEDFREFARDYYEIFMRSKSLSAKDADRLTRIIEFINNQMTLYLIFNKYSYEEYEKDLVKRGAVERWIENMINAATDIAKIVLASANRPAPYGYADTIHAASVYLKMEKEFWSNFLDWIKLRNVLAHEYLDIKWKKISGFIQNSEPYFKEFVETSKKFLEENHSS